MWGQVLFSIDRHYMAMDLPLCPDYPSLHHVVRGVAAAPPRRQIKMPQRHTVMQKEKNLMLPSLTSGRLTVSKTFGRIEVYVSYFLRYVLALMMQTMMSTKGQC